MHKNLKFANRLSKDEDGATAIEYGLLSALVAVVLIAAFSFVGDTLDETFTVVGDSLNEANEDNGGATVTKSTGSTTGSTGTTGGN